MDALIVEYIRQMKLTSGLNRQKIFNAWDKVSGAGRYTLGKFYSKGVLYCTISSSVLRSQLYLQRETILEALNAELEKDPQYDRGQGPVKSIVLK